MTFYGLSSLHIMMNNNIYVLHSTLFIIWIKIKENLIITVKTLGIIKIEPCHNRRYILNLVDKKWKLIFLFRKTKFFKNLKII